jgi:hypothetical protein
MVGGQTGGEAPLRATQLGVPARYNEANIEVAPPEGCTLPHVRRPGEAG